MAADEASDRNPPSDILGTNQQRNRFVQLRLRRVYKESRGVPESPTEREKPHLHRFKGLGARIDNPRVVSSYENPFPKLDQESRSRIMQRTGRTPEESFWKWLDAIKKEEWP